MRKLVFIGMVIVATGPGIASTMPSSWMQGHVPSCMFEDMVPIDSQAPASTFEYFGRTFSLDIPDFWTDEYQAMQTRALDLTRLETQAVPVDPGDAWGATHHASVNVTRVTYSPSDWNGASLLIDGDLYEPATPQPNGTLPGVLYMHGLYGDKRGGREKGLSIASKGGVCISISLPGHGLSNGPIIAPDTIFNYSTNETGRKSPVFFLGIQAGIGALRVLESIASVNASNLAITGDSWGGLHAQFIAGVEYAMNGNNRVKVTVVYMASGDILTSAREGSIANILRPVKLDPANPGETELAFAQDWDPMIYAAQVSNIHYIIGTNDEFFTLNAVLKTLEVIKLRQPNGTLGVTIFPGGHHGIGIPSSNRPRILRKYTWNENIALPTIEGMVQPRYNVFDQSMDVVVNASMPGMDPTGEIDYIFVGFKHHQLLDSWKVTRVEKQDATATTGGALISVTVPGPLFSCDADVVLGVVLEDGSMFTTKTFHFTLVTAWTCIIIPLAVAGMVLLMLAWYVRAKRGLLGRSCRGQDGRTREVTRGRRAFLEALKGWHASLDTRDIVLATRMGVLATCEGLTLWAFTLDWVGIGINNITHWLGPVDILKSELYAYLHPYEFIVGIVIALYVIALCTFTFAPRFASVLNILFATIIIVIVPVARFVILNLPRSDVLAGIMFSVEGGTIVTIVVAIAQIVFSTWFKRWRKAQGNRAPA